MNAINELENYLSQVESPPDYTGGLSKLDRMAYTHVPYKNPLEGVSEAFAAGIYESPGQVAAIVDEFSPWGSLYNTFTGSTMQQDLDEATGFNEMDYNPEDYAASESLKSLARLSGNLIGEEGLMGVLPMSLLNTLKFAPKGLDNLMTRSPDPFMNQLGALGYHYGRKPGLSEIDASFYGSGTKGAEAGYVSQLPDDLKPSFFYLDQGQGIKPEYTVRSGAQSVYRADLDNLYDAVNDPQGLRKAAQKKHGPNQVEVAREFYQSIKDAGYQGFESGSLVKGQGTAVVFGKTPVEELGPENLQGTIEGLKAADPDIILERTMKQGGYSVDPRTGDIPKSGYMVGVQDEKGVPIKKASGQDIESFETANKTVLDEKGNFVGTWIDDNKLKMDISQRFDDKTEALKAGYKGKQDAIFDLGQMEDIKLPFQGGRENLNRMSRDTAERLGYWHPIGDDLRLPMPFDEMTFESKPAYGLLNKVRADLESMQGGILTPAVGDRADVGRYVTSIGGVDFEDPILLEGGPGFMRSHSPHGSIWAGNKGAITKMNNRIQRILDEGYDPYLSYMPMSHGTLDFNTMMADSVLEQMKGGNISKTAKQMFDRKLRKLRPEWRGIDDPDSLAQLETNGALRHAFMDTVELKDFQKRGFPNLAMTRKAITDPNLYDTPLLQGGQSIGLLDGRIIDNPIMPHKTYDTQLGGKYVGGIDEGIPSNLLFPDFYAQRRLEGASPSSDYRSFNMRDVRQPMDQQWLDNIMNYLGE